MQIRFRARMALASIHPAGSLSVLHATDQGDRPAAVTPAVIPDNGIAKVGTADSNRLAGRIIPPLARAGTIGMVPFNSGETLATLPEMWKKLPCRNRNLNANG